MNGTDVLEVINQLEGAGVRVWLDGGWGVDALLGRQTRAHEDVDLVVPRQETSRAARALEVVGFEEDRDGKPGLPARLVLHDERGRRVDLHPVVLDSEGNGWQQLSDRAWGAYPAEDLTATGEIDGQVVPCISAELQLRHHLGYDWNERDRRDMGLLAQRFGLSLPPG
jgi:lincosamide nucleotidyltransferase A/C/D/E